MTTVINFLCAAVLAGTPFLFGTVGEIITERSGNLNLGVEGMMFMGGVAGIAGAYFYEQSAANPIGWVAAVIAVVCAFVCAALGALVYSFLTVTLRANQNVTGLSLTIFGTGFGNFFGEVLGNKAGGYVVVTAQTKEAFSVGIPGLSNIPVVGKLLFSYNFLVYLGILIAVLAAIYFSKTRSGLNLRAVGESPATADAAGINVTKMKYLATCIGGGICGIGGMYIVMVTCSGVWVHNCVNGYGWIAVARHLRDVEPAPRAARLVRVRRPVRPALLPAPRPEHGPVADVRRAALYRDGHRPDRDGHTPVQRARAARLLRHQLLP